MARAAFARAVEIRLARRDIAGEHIRRLVRVPIARCRFDALMQEMRQIENLILRQISRMIREFLHGWPDLVTEPVMQHHDGANEVGTIISAFHIASVTVDAVLGIHGATARCRHTIDNLAHRGAGLTNGKFRRQKNGDCHDENEKLEI